MKDDEAIEHDGKIFEKIQFQEKAISDRRFTDCIFRNCTLNMLSFIDCQFRDCVFEDCDLSLIKVKGSLFSRVQMVRCKAIGIHWFDTGNPFSIQFIDSNISYSSFFGKVMKKGKFKNCVIKEVDFSECNLTEADFSGADLEATRFSNSDLSAANFKEAKNYFIDVNFNKVKKAKFSLPEALSLLDGFGVVVE